MNDPDADKPVKEQRPNAPQGRRSLFFGGALFKEIGLVCLAGFAFAAVQWGGDTMDRLAKWIDGEGERPPAAVIAEASAARDFKAGAVVTVAEEIVQAKSGASDGGVLNVAGFRLNTDENWLVERMLGQMRPHPYFKQLLNPTLEHYGRNSALLLGVPDSYSVELPDDAGQIILLSKTVIINKKLTGKEIADALEKFGPDSLAVLSSPDSGAGAKKATPLTIEKDTPFIFNGNVDPALISENDLFDRYFLDQIATMRALQNTHGSIDLKHLRRRVIEGYEIGEIDYIIGPGTLRMTAVFYWHRQEHAQWGEFGLFLALRREPVSRKHRRMFETVSTLRLMDGARQIWRGLNYEAPADSETGAFVHVELNRDRLRAFGLNVRQVERALRAHLPILQQDFENIVIWMHGDASVYLRDVADLDLYMLGDDGMLRAPESIVLTVAH